MIAADGSSYTKRMLAFLAAHDEWLGPKHDYTVIHSVLAVPHRAAAFVGSDVVRKFYEDDAEAVFRPIRAFFQQQGIEATFVHGHGDLVNLVLGSVATKVLAKCSTPVLLVR